MATSGTPLVVQQTIEDNDGIAEEITAALEAQNPVNEARYNELLQELRECRNQLENLSTVTRTENPTQERVLDLVQQIQQRQEALAARVETLFVETQSLKDQIQSSSIPQAPPLAPVETVTEELTVAPALPVVVETPPPPPRRRVRLI